MCTLGRTREDGRAGRDYQKAIAPIDRRYIGASSGRHRASLPKGRKKAWRLSHLRVRRASTAGGEPNPGSSKRKRTRTIPSLRNHATRGDRGDETTIAVRTKKKALPGDRKKRGRGASAVAKRRAEVLAVTRKMPRDLTAIPLNAGRERSGTGIDRCCHQPNHSLRSLHIGKAIRSSWIAG